MRITLSLKWIPALACVAFAAFCVPGADAAERIIRPRRTVRGAAGTLPAAEMTIAAPAVASPVKEDGTSRAPQTTLTPPDGALLKTGLMRPTNLMREFGEEYAQFSMKDYQEQPANPPEAAPETPAPEKEKTKDKDTGKLVGDLPPYVSYDNYQDMNRQRQDFHPPMESEDPEESTASPDPAPGTAQPPKYAEPQPPEETPVPAPEPAAPPTPAEVENYRRRLELRLLERYNNLPEHAGNVGRVTVVLSKPLQPSLDGTRLRAEFDQLVYDPWGKRIPSLEKEYHVVTFSAGGVRQVRSDPSIRVGLNHERTYSEPGPDSDIAEKVRTLPPDHAFRAAPRTDEVPQVKMPDWWRPEFADDGY